MNIRHGISLRFALSPLYIVFCAACADSAAPPEPDSVDTAPVAVTDPDPLPSDLDALILGKVYATDVSVPDGFLEDPSQQLAVSFSLAHLRTDNAGLTGQHDLCSDDVATATAWSDIASPDWPIVTIEQNQQYFEVTRQRTDLADWWAIHRVYRCAFVERSGADPLAETAFAGRLGTAWRSADSLAFMAQYLWQFSRFNNPGGTVLGSSTEATDGGFRHTLELALLVPGAGSTDGCDRIERVDWHYDLMPDGTLWRSLEAVRSFDARDSSGTLELCPG